VVNQAGQLSSSHTTRKSAVNEVLANSLKFLGSKTVLGIEVIKQEQLAFNISGLDFLKLLGHFPFFKPTEILQFNLMN